MKQGSGMAKRSFESTGDKKSGGVILNQGEIKELVASAVFSSRLLISTHTSRPFFYFRQHGDSLEGFLGLQHSNTNLRRCASRIMETDYGIEEFFVNQKLAKVFKQFDLEGKYIKITYIGDELTGFGHARKCYQVEKFAVTDREQMSLQSGKPGTRKKRGPK